MHGLKWPASWNPIRNRREALTIYSFYMFVYEYLQMQAVRQLIHDEMNPDLEESMGYSSSGGVFTLTARTSLHRMNAKACRSVLTTVCFHIIRNLETMHG